MTTRLFVLFTIVATLFVLSGCNTDTSNQPANETSADESAATSSDTTYSSDDATGGPSGDATTTSDSDTSDSGDEQGGGATDTGSEGTSNDTSVLPALDENQPVVKESTTELEAQADAAGQSVPSGADNSSASTAAAQTSADNGQGDQSQDVADEEPEEPVDPEEAFRRELTQALQVGDNELAMKLMRERYEENPDDMTLKLNYFALRVGLDAKLVGDDLDKAAERFLETAKMAEQLQPLREQLPSSLSQLFVAAKMNESRAYAHQEKPKKAFNSLFAALQDGLSDLEWIKEDPFFDKILDNESFQQRLKSVWVDLAKKELAEFESFSFDFQLPNLEGETVSLNDLKGDVAIVDIWGTWCPPCRKEIPHFVKLQSKYPEQLSIVGINYENSEGEEAVAAIREFAETQSIDFNYPCVLGDDATRQQVPNFEGFPTTLFLDRTGKVRLKVVGYHSYDKLHGYVKALLAESNEQESESEEAEPTAG